MFKNSVYFLYFLDLKKSDFENLLTKRNIF